MQCDKWEQHGCQWKYPDERRDHPEGSAAPLEGCSHRSAAPAVRTFKRADTFAPFKTVRRAGALSRLPHISKVIGTRALFKRADRIYTNQFTGKYKRLIRRQSATFADADRGCCYDATRTCEADAGAKY